MSSLLNHNLIQHYLKTDTVELIIKNSISSTNDYLKALKNNKTLQACICEEQTQGRGRLGKLWQSPFGENIYCSLKLPLPKPHKPLNELSMAMAIMLHELLQSHLLKQTLMIKWPNDILANEKKLAGILIECIYRGEDCFVVIGFGINVNMTQHANIDQPWASLKMLTNEEFDRNLLVAKLIDETVSLWQHFMTNEYTLACEYFSKYDYLFNQPITLITQRGYIQGTAQGINQNGLLLLALPNGQIEAFNSGEVSIEKKTTP